MYLNIENMADGIRKNTDYNLKWIVTQIRSIFFQDIKKKLNRLQNKSRQKNGKDWSYKILILTYSGTSKNIKSVVCKGLLDSNLQINCGNTRQWKMRRETRHQL